MDAPEFAVGELPRRMRSAGMRILHAPKSTDRMPTAEPTGLVWWIDFQMGAYRGVVHPSLDPVLYKRGGLAPNGCMEALVVTVTK